MKKSRFNLLSAGMPFIPQQRQGSSTLAATRPFDATALLDKALALHQAGRLEKAERLYRKILQHEPKNYDCLHLLGIIHHQRGNHIEAIRQFDVVLKDNPGFSAAHNNRGNALKELKRYEEALASYDRAIALRPDNADALSNRGVVLYGLRRFEEALANVDAAIALNPDHVEAFNNRGSALKELKRYDDALASCEQAIMLRPDHADALSNRGVILYEMRDYDQALASYDQALAVTPNDAEIIKNRGNALTKLKRLREAVVAFDRAIALKPDLQLAEGLRLHAKMSICDWRNYENNCSRLKSALKRGIAGTQPLTLLSIPSESSLHRKCAELYIADKCYPAREPLWRGERYSHDRIRVAYISADFREHPVAVLTAGMFEHHDRSRFETIAISLGPDTQDGLRKRLVASFDRFFDVQTKSDRDIAGLVRELEVDVAIDLNGFTDGSRLNIFVDRPAPIQVNYLGYAGTMGNDHWDYILADRFVIPEERHDHYAEKVVYLPDSFMTADAGREISDRVPSRGEAGLPESGFVFCCFNAAHKLSPDVFAIWMRLLQEVEGSVLWLSGQDSAAIQNLHSEALRRGVAPERLIFAPRVDLNRDHLARYRLADLFLDTLHYNAHATASDALWAGVPILTCSGATFASRVAGSLLNAIGLPEMVARSPDEYEAMALRLARDPALLASAKRKLTHNRGLFPLFNTERFTRHIEAAYTTMWERYQRGESPQSFAVAALS